MTSREWGKSIWLRRQKNVPKNQCFLTITRRKLDWTTFRVTKSLHEHWEDVESKSCQEAQTWSLFIQLMRVVVSYSKRQNIWKKTAFHQESLRNSTFLRACVRSKISECFFGHPRGTHGAQFFCQYLWIKCLQKSRKVVKPLFRQFSPKKNLEKSLLSIKKRIKLYQYCTHYFIQCSIQTICINYTHAETNKR